MAKYRLKVGNYYLPRRMLNRKEPRNPVTPGGIVDFPDGGWQPEANDHKWEKLPDEEEEGLLGEEGEDGREEVKGRGKEDPPEPQLDTHHPSATGLTVRSKGGGWYEVVKEDTGEAISDASLRRDEAYEMAGLEIPQGG